MPLDIPFPSPFPLWVTAIASAIAGVLSGMGIGSAGIFVLYLTMFLQMDQVAAQGINLLFFLVSAGASLIYHIPHRHIPWRVVIFLLIFAFPGAAFGTYLVSRLDKILIRRLFGTMLVVSGGMTLFQKKKSNEEKSPDHPQKHPRTTKNK